MMIRVKIRYNSGSHRAKLLRFDESIEFEDLLRKIVQKLGITISITEEPALSALFELTLGGDVLVEDTSEIDHGDELELTRKISVKPDTASSQEDGQAEQSDNKRGHASTKQEEEVQPDATLNQEELLDESANRKIETEPLGADEEECSVQDMTECAKRERTRKAEEDAICLSSDSEDEDDDDDGSVEEGSDGWEEESEKEEASEADDSGDSDYDEDTEKKAQLRLSQKQRHNKPPPESPLEVTMDEKDTPAAPGKPADLEPSNGVSGLEEVSTLVDKAGKKKADQGIKDRVIKLLNTGFHDKSNEHEAKNAMKLAQRLMNKHNLSQALLLKERDAKNKNQEGEILKGGMVRVKIRNRKTGKPAVYARWIANLAVTVAKNFSVECYHSVRRGVACDVTFYGIYTNAQLAGYAFRVATERVAQMTADYQPTKTWYRNVNTKSSRLSYSIGIVKGISDEVNRNIRMEKEKRERKLERARLASSKGEAYEESDNEEENLCHENDGPSFDVAADYGNDKSCSYATSPVSNTSGSGVLGGQIKPMGSEAASAKEGEDADDAAKAKSTLSGSDLESRVEQLEKEQQAAIVLVDHSEKIAEDVLKEEGIKLRTGRKRKRIQFDHQSYDQGIEDSKEIDINQRAIRDGVRVKKEKRAKRERK